MTHLICLAHVMVNQHVVNRSLRAASAKEMGDGLDGTRYHIAYVFF